MRSETDCVEFLVKLHGMQSAPILRNMVGFNHEVTAGMIRALEWVLGPVKAAEARAESMRRHGR